MFEQDEFWMRKAIEAAENAGELNEVPIGACLIDNEGNLLAVAGNRTITDSDPTAHAEILVLREAARKIGNYRLTEAIVYSTIEPCAMCAGALVNAQSQKIGLRRERRTLRRGRNTFRHLRQQFFESQNRNHIRRFSRRMPRSDAKVFSGEKKGKKV